MGYKAVDIADYIISRCIDTSHPISNLQLNKIMYFVQKDFLMDNVEGLFDENFEAWQFGPVVPEVYYKYCGFGGMCILFKPQTLINLTPEVQTRIDSIVDSKKILNPWQLVNETHKPNGAWDITFKNGLGNHVIIPKSLIRSNG